MATQVRGTRATQYVFLLFGGETTVTRRPNNLASTEYAPGPRSASAAASNIRKTQMKLPELKPISRLATPAAHAITDIKGVRNPTTSKIEINSTPAKSRGAEDTPNLFAKFMSKVAATEVLRRNSAKPGPPSGNIAKSRCTH